MNKSMVWICVLVGSLGLITFFLGIGAEAKHTRVTEVRMTKEGACLYPRSPALTMGVMAALALMMAQVVINVAAGCLCWGSHISYQNPFNTAIAAALLLLSWVSFVIAFVLFLAGAALNDHHNEQQGFFTKKCYVIKTGVFATGAVLSLVTVCLGIGYYTVSYAVKSSAAWMHQNQDQSIGMTPSNARPIFVPENMYSDFPGSLQYYEGRHSMNTAVGAGQESLWK